MNLQSQATTGESKLFGLSSSGTTAAAKTEAAKEPGKEVNTPSDLELFEQEKIEDVLTSWERKLTRHVEDFRRYSRAIIDMDSILFDYVDKLATIQKQQEEVQSRQQELLSVVDKIELKQKSILESLNQMEAKWVDKGRQLEGKPSSLEGRAISVNKLITDLEDEVLSITEGLDEIEALAYPDGLYQLLLLTNSHCKYINRLTEYSEQISRQTNSFL